MKKNGLVVDIDGDCLWYISNMHRKDYSDLENKLRSYVRRYQGHGITDLVYCISGLVSSVPTKVLTFYGDKVLWKEEHGIPVDYSEHDRIKPYHEMEKTGLDCYSILLEETAACGMHPWISVRMNDIHDNDKTTSFLRGKLFYTVQDNGWNVGGDGISPYFQKCMNYGVKEVRDIMLAYIEEQINHFDVYGLELDFQREIYCFDYRNDKNACAVMNDFIRNVRRILDKAEEKWGHPIKLAMHLLRDVAENKAFGFDVEAWVKEGLADALIPSPRWGTCDHLMPLAEWKKITDGTKTELWAGQEILCHVSDSMEKIGCGNLKQSAETVKGFTAAYLSAGADKTYLYNFYQTCFLTKTVSGETPADYTWASASWEGASSLANAQKGVRRYVAGYQDICPEGYEAFKPFPMEINGSSSFDMLTGPLPQGEEVTVILGLDPMKDTGLALSVDGQEAKSVPVPEDAFILTRIGEITDAVQKEKAKTFAVYRGFAYKATGDGNVRTLTASGKNAVIKYIEIIVGKSED